MSERQVGWIKTLKSDKEFGFIRVEGDQEYFFHRDDCDGAVWNKLKIGTQVMFTPSEGRKGPRAAEVTLA